MRRRSTSVGRQQAHVAGQRPERGSAPGPARVGGRGAAAAATSRQPKREQLLPVAGQRTTRRRAAGAFLVSITSRLRWTKWLNIGEPSTLVAACTWRRRARGHVAVAPALGPTAPGEVRVLVVHEEPLIEEADVVRGRRAGTARRRRTMRTRPPPPRTGPCRAPGSHGRRRSPHATRREPTLLMTS